MGPLPDSRPNILLIVIDSVRASNTNLHGNGNNTTPFLEEFASQSTVYEQARAPSIWSLPSHVSMFTGVPPHVHGVTRSDQSLQQGHSIWEKLVTEYGYSTGVFTSNAYLTETPVGLSNLFGTVKGRDEIIRYPEALSPARVGDDITPTQYLRMCIKNEKTVQSITNGLEMKGRKHLPNKSHLSKFLKEDQCGAHADNFKIWIEERSGPWAACINFMDAHRPYLPKEEFNIWADSSLKSLQDSINHLMDFPSQEEPWWKCKALEALYDGSIRQMDAEIDGIITYLKNNGLYNNTHIVITGDHGEGFGEFCNTRTNVRYVAHGYGVGEALLHVPLLSKRPGQQSGEIRDGLASLTSLYDVIESSVKQVEASEMESFEKDRVFVSSHERGDQLNKYLGSNSRYHGDAFAVYREEEDTIQKFTKWESDESIITIARERSAPVLSVKSVSHGEVDRMLATSRQDMLNESGVESENLDESIKGRLEDLGYM